MDILFNSGWTKARERRLTFHRVNCTMNTNGLFQVVDQIDRQKDMEYLWIHRKIEKDCSRPCLSPWITPRSTSHTTPSKSHCRMSNYALDTHMHWRPTCPKLSSSSTNQFILLLCSCSFNLIQFLKTGFIFISSPPPRPSALSLRAERVPDLERTRLEFNLSPST